MGSVRDGNDHMTCEGFLATLKYEWIHRCSCQDSEQVPLSIIDFLEEWYQTHRSRSSGNDPSPVEFEERYRLQAV